VICFTINIPKNKGKVNVNIVGGGLDWAFCSVIVNYFTNLSTSQLGELITAFFQNRSKATSNHIPFTVIKSLAAVPSPISPHRFLK
jgi:hypothetical protein